MYIIKISKYLDSSNVDGEWTDYCDIGKKFKHDKTLTVAEYMFYENKYIQLIFKCLNFFNLPSLLIAQLDDYRDAKYNNFCKIEDKQFTKIFSTAMVLNLPDIELISRLSIRTHLWCELANKDLSFRINFNDGLYFFIQTNNKMLFEFLKNDNDYSLLNISLTSPEFEL